MNKELIEALDVLEKEKEISKETLLEAIENSLVTACKNHFGKADNVKGKHRDCYISENEISCVRDITEHKVGAFRHVKGNCPEVKCCINKKD